jgi:hypothetical protein
MIKNFADTLRPHMNFIVTFVITGVLVWSAFHIRETEADAVINLATICLGSAIGTCVGTAISPIDEKEQKRFASYGKAVVAFLTGYFASKLDGAINAVLASAVIASPTQLTCFRILAFTTTALVFAKVTFTCRSYES